MQNGNNNAGTQYESINTDNNEVLKPKFNPPIKRVEEITNSLNHKKTRTIVFSP